MSPLKKETPKCECTKETVCKPCHEKARMKVKGRDYGTEESDPGSHIGPPAEKAPRCGEKVKTVRWGLVFACNEAMGHSGSHYAISEGGVGKCETYDIAWNGPDELKKGKYN